MSLRYFELVCQVILCCVLCAIFPAFFLSVCECVWRFFLKTEWADLKEQRVCVKFGFLLVKTAVETVTMLKEAIKDKSMSKHKCMSGFIISKEVKCLLKTNHVLDSLP